MFLLFYYFYFSDGRLRIGDEIVNVNGHHLRGIQSHSIVQQMLMTFVDNSVDLVIAHDELTTFQTSDYAQQFKVDCRSNNKNNGHHHQIINKNNTNAAYMVNETSTVKKRLSFTESSDLMRNTTNILIESTPLTTNSDYKQLGDSTNLEQNLYNGQRRSSEQLQHHQLSRRSSLNKSLALTPLYNSTEYIPVYANRVTITNTISDDEKWQILSKKRSDDLTTNGGYSHHISSKDHIFQSKPNQLSRAMSNDAVYALCRPVSAIASTPSNTTTLEIKPLDIDEIGCAAAVLNTTNGFHPQYRTIKINRDLCLNRIDDHLQYVQCNNNTLLQSAYYQKQPSQYIGHNPFGIQKSQTDTCIPAHAQLMFVDGYSNNNDVQQLQQQTMRRRDDAKCDTTISIQINEEGESYVEGNSHRKLVYLFMLSMYYILFFQDYKNVFI